MVIFFAPWKYFISISILCIYANYEETTFSKGYISFCVLNEIALSSEEIIDYLRYTWKYFGDTESGFKKKIFCRSVHKYVISLLRLLKFSACRAILVYLKSSIPSHNFNPLQYFHSLTNGSVWKVTTAPSSTVSDDSRCVWDLSFLVTLLSGLSELL